MPDLVAITALGDIAARQIRAGALTLSENTSAALASVMMRRRDDPPTIFGMTLPGPGRASEGEGVLAVWSAPGQWLIAGEGRAEEDFAGELVKAAPGAAVTDQTDSWVVFEIVSSGGASPLTRLLEKLANIDLAEFSPRSATRTWIDHMSVFVVRRSYDRLSIWGMRSAAHTIWHALTKAAVRLEPVP